jgi:hypothetical protein
MVEQLEGGRVVSLARAGPDVVREGDWAVIECAYNTINAWKITLGPSGISHKDGFGAHAFLFHCYTLLCTLVTRKPVLVISGE